MSFISNIISKTKNANEGKIVWIAIEKITINPKIKAISLNRLKLRFLTSVKI